MHSLSLHCCLYCFNKHLIESEEVRRPFNKPHNSPLSVDVVMTQASSSSSSVSAWNPSASIASDWKKKKQKKKIVSPLFLSRRINSSQTWVPYRFCLITSLHKFGDGHAACASPFVSGRSWGGLGSCRRVSLRACGCLQFFTGLFSSSCGEVGPLAGNWKSLPAKMGQDVCVHIPAATPEGGALLVHSIVPDEAF